MHGELQSWHFRSAHTLLPKGPTGLLQSLSLPGPAESLSLHSWLFRSSCPLHFSEGPAFSESRSFLQEHTQSESFTLSNKLHSKEVAIGSSTSPSSQEIGLYFYHIILMIPPEYKERSNIFFEFAVIDHQELKDLTFYHTCKLRS